MKNENNSFDDMTAVTMKNRSIEDIQKDLVDRTISAIDPEPIDHPYATTDTGTILTMRRDLMGEKDKAAAVTKSINATISELDKEMLARSTRDGGITQYKGDGITVSIVEQETVEIDGDFVEIVEALVSQGYAYCIKKGLAPAKIKELDALGVRLPDGISIKTFRKIKPLRSKKAGG